MPCQKHEVNTSDLWVCTYRGRKYWVLDLVSTEIGELAHLAYLDWSGDFLVDSAAITTLPSES